MYTNEMNPLYHMHRFRASRIIAPGRIPVNLREQGALGPRDGEESRVFSGCNSHSGSSCFDDRTLPSGVTRSKVGE